MSRGSPAPVWLVATEESAARFARFVEEAGRAARPLPWAEVVEPPDPQALPTALADGPDLVLLTSANATRFLPPGAGTGRTAACVGEHTAEAARRLGFDVVVVGSAGAGDLAERILAERPDATRILFLRGDHARDDAVQRLRAVGRSVVAVVAYGTRPRAAFVSEVREAPAPAALVLGSPRAAGALADALDASDRRDVFAVPALAVGDTTAAEAQALGFTNVVAAGRPDRDAVVRAVRDL